MRWGALLLVVVVVLAGCSGIDTTVGEPTPTPTATPTASTTPTPEPTATIRRTPRATPTEVNLPRDTPYRTGNVVVRIGGPGDWEGAVVVDGSVRRLMGSGERRISVGSASSVSLNAQKQSRGDWPITVEILVDGDSVAGDSTRSEYATVRTSARFR